jgi:hypothetical protein
MSRKINNPQGTALVVHQDGVLTPQQEVVVLQLMGGATQRDAAERGGVTPETVSRWLHQDAQFVAELNRRRRAVWEAHADALRSLAGRAIGTLDALLDADDERVQLAAAAAILKATALQNAGRPGGPTSEAEIRMDWMLSESMGMR